MRRISERIKTGSWSWVIIDFVVVVVGILLALQLDAWAQQRDERQLEALYLVRIVEDLEIERTRMDAAAGHARDRIEAARLLERVVADPSLAASETVRMPWAIET